MEGEIDIICSICLAASARLRGVLARPSPPVSLEWQKSKYWPVMQFSSFSCPPFHISPPPPPCCALLLHCLPRWFRWLFAGWFFFLPTLEQRVSRLTWFVYLEKLVSVWSTWFPFSKSSASPHPANRFSIWNKITDESYYCMSKKSSLGLHWILYWPDIRYPAE